MSRLLVAQRALTVPGWAKDALWRRAQAIPSLDLRFADNKSLVDAVTGASLITFARAYSGTYVDSAGVLQTAAIDVPRFDHNPTTGESLGLLVEEPRTNSVTNNTMVGAVAGSPGTLPTGWATFVSPTGLTRTIVGSGTVNGINYIDVRFNGTPSSTGEISLYLSPATTATLAQAWTTTAWLSIAGGSTSNIGGIILRNFELNSGTYVREISTNYLSSISSDFVRRQNITTSFGASANQIQLVFSMYATAANTPIDITLRIGLPQLEQGAYATSPILTSTAQATRSADVASITGTAFSGWYRQDEGTMFVQGSTSASASNPILFQVEDGTANERIQIRRIGATNLASSIVSDGGVNQGGPTSAGFNADTIGKVGFSYALNNLQLAFNGTLGTGDTSATVPTVDRAFIGSASSPVYANGHISRITYWPQALPSRLQALTQ